MSWTFSAELRVAQAENRVVPGETVLRLGRRLDVPAIERLVERGGDLLGQLRLAGARLALDEQRPRERDRRVDGHHQIVGGDIGLGTRKFLLLHEGPRPARCEPSGMAILGRARRNGKSPCGPPPRNGSLRCGVAGDAHSR
jgi:hypothetical protein